MWFESNDFNGIPVIPLILMNAFQCLLIPVNDMNKITFDEYKNAIKTQYEKIKTEDITGILMNPSPAQLRNWCLIYFDNGLFSNDERIMKLFFNVKEEDNLRKCIEKCEISKFRPIRSFLIGEKETENMTRIEMAAIMVDYNPRPYKRYIQSGDKINVKISTIEKKKVIVRNDLALAEFNKNEVVVGGNITMRKAVVFFTVLLLLFFAICTVNYFFFPTKECMQWNENHYETVDCYNVKLGIGQLNLIVPIDNQIIKLEKLDSNRGLDFFKNDKPIVWYSKEEGKIELFNQPGFHPETAKPLKPITDYIIHKYQLKSKSN